MPKDTPKNTYAAGSANRLSGKTASDTFKGGNNAGMLFKKEAKAATTTTEYRTALERLRAAEIKDDRLRSFTPR